MQLETPILDCLSGLCMQGTCVSMQCTDGAMSGLETDVDCGGPECAPCATNQHCAMPSDCVTRVCTGSVCHAPSCTDGVKNGSETGPDCGGGCPGCGADAGCAVATDCSSHVCIAMVCRGPTCSDAVQNQLESDVDCGGLSPCRRCDGSRSCDAGTDCLSGTCTAFHCTVPPLFGTPVFFATQSSPQSVGIGDVDLDSNPDFVVGNAVSASVSIYYGDGDGGFAGPYHVGIASSGWEGPIGVAISDLDGDNHGDIIAAQMPGGGGYLTNDACRVTVLPGTAMRGIFGAPVFNTVLDAGQYSGCGTDIIIARIDADSTPDLLMGDHYEAGCCGVPPNAGDLKGGYFLKGTGSTTLAPSLRPSLGSFLTLFDVDGDGKLDAVSHNERLLQLRVAYGDGAGGFTAGWTQTVNAGPGAVGVGNFNADNVPDLVVATSANSSINIMFGSDAGTWSSPYTATLNAVRGLVVGDFDGDGNDDVVGGARNGAEFGIGFFKGHRDGTLSPPVRYGTSQIAYTFYVARGDFNKDGKPDIITVANGAGDGVWLYLNQHP